MGAGAWWSLITSRMPRKLCRGAQALSSAVPPNDSLELYVLIHVYLATEERDIQS